MHANGASRITVVNRSEERAGELALKFNGDACTFEHMYARLHDVDILISSTGASGYIIKRKDIEPNLQKRKSRPLFMIDIAVPRDLDPELNDVPNVFLYDIDDLEGIVESNLALRRQECAKIEKMIDLDIDAYNTWYRTLEVVPVIRALQEKSASVHEEVLENLWRKLPDLDERERKVIHKLTKSIVSQLIHDPILQIKDMAAQRSGHDAIEMFTKIFDLEKQVASQKAERSTTTKRTTKPEREDALLAKSALSATTSSLAARS